MGAYREALLPRHQEVSLPPRVPADCTITPGNTSRCGARMKRAARKTKMPSEALASRQHVASLRCSTSYVVCFRFETPPFWADWGAL